VLYDSDGVGRGGNAFYVYDGSRHGEDGNCCTDTDSDAIILVVVG
jgi:hypothetical protein